jgi:hypothetical protein
MITKDDLNKLDLYFKSLSTIPTELTNIVAKIDKANIINKADAELQELMKAGE